jgi:hypothetical protein
VAWLFPRPFRKFPWSLGFDQAAPEILNGSHPPGLKNLKLGRSGWWIGGIVRLQVLIKTLESKKPFDATTATACPIIRGRRDAVFSRLALACALVYLLAIPAIAQSGTPQKPPALVGTWVLRVPDSEALPFPDIKSQTIAMTCVGNRVEISATTNGEESVARFMADGKQRRGRTIPPLSHAEVVSSRWEGTSLVLTIVGGSWATGVSTMTERWTPSLDGRTLTRSWGGFKALAMVYDKRPAQ